MKLTSRAEDSDLLPSAAANSVSQYVFRCSCFQQIFPSLKVRIGDLSIHKSEDTTLVNPIQLRQYLEERLQLDDSYRNAE